MGGPSIGCEYGLAVKCDIGAPDGDGGKPSAEISICLGKKVLCFHHQERVRVAGGHHSVFRLLDRHLINKQIIELTLRVVVHHVCVRAEQKRVDGHTLFAVRDGEILRDPDHGRRDYVMEWSAGPRSTVRVGENSRIQELTCKKLVPMELAFPVSSG